jgi:hypothetical protein
MPTDIQLPKHIVRTGNRVRMQMVSYADQLVSPILLALILAIPSALIPWPTGAMVFGAGFVFGLMMIAWRLGPTLRCFVEFRPGVMEIQRSGYLPAQIHLSYVNRVILDSGDGALDRFFVEDKTGNVMNCIYVTKGRYSFDFLCLLAAKMPAGATIVRHVKGFEPGNQTLNIIGTVAGLAVGGAALAIFVHGTQIQDLATSGALDTMSQSIMWWMPLPMLLGFGLGVSRFVTFLFLQQQGKAPGFEQEWPPKKWNLDAALRTMACGYQTDSSRFFEYGPIYRSFDPSRIGKTAGAWLAGSLAFFIALDGILFLEQVPYFWVAVALQALLLLVLFAPRLTSLPAMTAISESTDDRVELDGDSVFVHRDGERIPASSVDWPTNYRYRMGILKSLTEVATPTFTVKYDPVNMPEMPRP